MRDSSRPLVKFYKIKSNNEWIILRYESWIDGTKGRITLEHTEDMKRFYTPGLKDSAMETEPSIEHGIPYEECIYNKSDQQASLDMLPDDKKKQRHFGLRANAIASTNMTCTSTYTEQHSAGASACTAVAEADASADLIDGIIGVQAHASAAKAAASASASLLGADAGAYAHAAKAECGIKNTPLHLSLSAFGVEAQAGVSPQYIGASVGAYIAETRIGPFGVRAGVKFGAAIEKGIPIVDTGLVTTPCSIM